MSIDPQATVADIARTAPATIKVFQQHGLDFCCGGKIPLGEAFTAAGLDAEQVLGDLARAVATTPAGTDWNHAPLADLIDHIQTRFHVPLRQELPRLRAMLAKVVSRHGERHPEALLPLQQVYDRLADDLLEHMAKEDEMLFPAILDRAQGRRGGLADVVDQPIAAMEADHDDAGRALAEMRRLTHSYMPPPDACPTFIGLYWGLAELERDMHEHVHLENNILFPRAVASS